MAVRTGEIDAMKGGLIFLVVLGQFRGKENQPAL